MRYRDRRPLMVIILIAMALLPACAGVGPLCGPETTPEAKSPDQAALQHWEKAMAYRAEGQLDKARTELELALKTDPNMYQAYYQLGLIYKEMGEEMMASEVWKRGLEKARNGPEREDYPRQRAIAQMEAALIGLKDQGQAARPAQTTRPSRPAQGGYAVLYSSSLNPAYARRDQNNLKRLGFTATVKTARIKGKTFHRVLAGCCTERAGAQSLASQMRAKGVKGTLTVMRP